MNQPAQNKYDRVAQLLHWVIASLIILNYVLAKLADKAHLAEQPLRQLALLANHKSIGMTLLALIVIRIYWRLTHLPPQLPTNVPRWQRLVSACSHWGLYILMLAIPLSGWVLASASNYGLSWFNHFEIPAVVSQDESLKDLAATIHQRLNTALFWLAILHITAALHHHFVTKDDILKRMSSRLTYGIFSLILILGLTTSVQRQPPMTTPAAGSNTSTSEIKVTTNDQLPLWNIDYAQSSIIFSGEQAGAKFSGQWPSWQAKIQFDGDTLQAIFDVSVNVTKVETQDIERNQTMMQSEWFDIENFPQARFELYSVKALDDNRFQGDGRTTIKSISIDTPFEFQVESNANQMILIGTARLDRFNFNLGLGEWSDTSWIGQFVDVDVKVIATQ